MLTTCSPFFLKVLTIVFFQIPMAYSYGRTPESMKNAVYIAELIRPGNPAFAEISVASISITFSFLSAIIILMALGIDFVISSKVLQLVLRRSIDPGLQL
jgi:sorbitol-specific phosphotransferase system component IIC